MLLDLYTTRVPSRAGSFTRPPARLVRKLAAPVVPAVAVTTLTLVVKAPRPRVAVSVRRITGGGALAAVVPVATWTLVVRPQYRRPATPAKRASALYGVPSGPLPPPPFVWSLKMSSFFLEG